MRAADKEFNSEITEVGAKKSAASVNENNRQRNQDADYGSGSKKDGYSVNENSRQKIIERISS
jgi:general stress protein YciG